MTELTFPRFLTMLCLVTIPVIAHAQPAVAPAPPPGWIASASAGLALTSGNSDTSTVNAAYELKRDTGGVIVLKSNGLMVYGKSQDVLTNDRLALDGRVERKLSTRTSLFGQTQYLRDSFKAIDYLVSPTVGMSQILVKDDRTELAADAGVGAVWEQNTDLELRTDGAVGAGQQLSRKLTVTTELKQKAAALWRWMTSATRFTCSESGSRRASPRRRK